MTQLFIAYKRPDQDRAATVRQKLETLGVELFVDHQIKGGDNYIAIINNELDTALAALVLWSTAAVALPKRGQHNFLLAEAQKAWRRDILIMATFDKVILDNLPVPFNTFQTADLSDWLDSGTPANHRGWLRLLEALGAKLGRPGLPSLALALESPDVAAKRDFIRAFPGDIFAERLADEIIAAERVVFNEVMATAQSKVERRKRDGEKILKECQRLFESQMVRLRKGEDFSRPDPVKMLADEVTALKDQNEVYESKIDELFDRVEQSKLTISQANEKISDLTKQTEQLSEQRNLAETATAELPKVKSDLEYLQREDAAKASELERRAAQIETLKKSLQQAQKEREAQQRDVKRLQGENTELRMQLPGAPRSIRNSPRLLLAAGGVAGVLLGAILVQTSDYFQTGANDTDAIKTLDQRAHTLDIRETRLKEQESKQANKEKTFADTAARTKQTMAEKQKALERHAAALASGERGLATRKSELARQNKQIDELKLTLSTQSSALKDEEKKFADLTAHTNHMWAVRQEALDRRAAALASSEKENSAAKAELARQTKKANQLQLALNSREAVLKSHEDRLSGRELKIAQRDSVEKTTDKNRLRAGIIAQLDLKKPTTQPLSPPKNSADECDMLAGTQYDRDRPAVNHWQNNIFETPLAKALTVCQSALTAAQSNKDAVVEQRRILMEIGRIMSAQSIVEAKKGNLPDAKKLFDQALGSMQKSANLGSAHASYLLGTFYRGDIAVKGTPKGDFTTVKDLNLAWDYFVKAANGGDPVGLTTVAFGYLLPDWTDKMVKQNIDEGKSYLNKALKTQFPRAQFLLGLATIEGRGFPKNCSEGIKQIEAAFCKNDSSAQTYVKSHHLKPPSCS